MGPAAENPPGRKEQQTHKESKSQNSRFQEGLDVMIVDEFGFIIEKALVSCESDTGAFLALYVTFLE